jgi:hypothetical protein
MKTKIFILGMIACLLSACAGSASPKLIASQKTENPIAAFPLANSPPTEVIYTTTIELEVNKVDKANGRVREIAYQQGGYMSESQSWYQDGEEHVMLELVVPVYRFETVHNLLLDLGDVKNERLFGKLVEPGDYPRQDYTHIVVFLHPKTSTGLWQHLPDWRPLRTLTQAWEVFLSISGFILDVAIWLVVVVGPFALIAWGIRRLFRRWKRTQENNPTDPGSGTTTGA